VSIIRFFIDFILHLDTHLDQIIQQFGMWTYLILFAIVFCETGLVVTPFLPGDSLLFAVGAFTARPDSLQLLPSLLVLIAAAILGDTVNYWVGARVGPAVFQRENVRFLNKKHLQRTHEFYERHGGKTIILARFIPIIRTFAPFVAGIGSMSYLRFLAYNVVGGVAWVLLFVLGGHFFGNLPLVKRNFTLVIMAIIVISVLPGVFEYFRQRRLARKNS
jgi:membrane-associated protein